MRQISDELVQSILNYLVTKPYSEVYKVVSALMVLPMVPKSESKKDTKPKSPDAA